VVSLLNPRAFTPTVYTIRLERLVVSGAVGILVAGSAPVAGPGMISEDDALVCPPPPRVGDWSLIFVTDLSTGAPGIEMADAIRLNRSPSTVEAFEIPERQTSKQAIIPCSVLVESRLGYVCTCAQLTALQVRI
jgi:hypothetical protein